MELDENALGARIKRVFTAFLVSNFVSFIQVWLGLEYNKLAKDFDEFSAQQLSSAGDLARASVLFKKASRLTFALFALGISMLVIDYVGVYGIEFSFLRQAFSSSLSSFPATYFTAMLDVFVIIFLFAIVISCFSLATNITLREAWTLVLSYFKASDHGEFWMPEARKQLERVIKGTRKSIVSSGLSIMESILAMIFFSLLIPFMLAPAGYGTGMYTTMLGYAYGSAVIGIVMLILMVVTVVFGLQGTINQGIGLFDLAKALQGQGAVAWSKASHNMQHGSEPSPPRLGDRAIQEKPMPASAPVAGVRFCRACGLRLQPEWNAVYCPSCGIKLI